MKPGLGSNLFRILEIWLGLSRIVYAKFHHDATDCESGGQLKTRNKTFKRKLNLDLK